MDFTLLPLIDQLLAREIVADTFARANGSLPFNFPIAIPNQTL